MKLKLTSLALISILSLGLGACSSGSDTPQSTNSGGGNDGNDNGGGDDSGGGDDGGSDNGSGGAPSVILPSNNYQDVNVSTAGLSGLWVFEHSGIQTYTGTEDAPYNNGSHSTISNSLVRIHGSAGNYTATVCEAEDNDNDETSYVHRNFPITIEGDEFEFDNTSGEITSGRLLTIKDETTTFEINDNGIATMTLQSQSFGYKINDNPNAEIGTVTVENNITYLTCLTNTWGTHHFPQSNQENDSPIAVNVFLGGIAGGNLSDRYTGFVWTEDRDQNEHGGLFHYFPVSLQWLALISSNFTSPYEPYLSYQGEAVFDTAIGGKINVNLNIDYRQDLSQ